MVFPTGISRVILVVLDGLRPDAVPLFPLTHIRDLARRGAHTWRGRTVEPSVTAAAVASLFTGVAPAVHRIRSERFGVPRPAEPLTVLPRYLREHGFPTHGHMAAVPAAFRGIAARITAQAGADVTFAGREAAAILEHGRATLTHQRRGLVYFHWPDADLAGHADGWMSPAYAEAARRLDREFERLVRLTGVLEDPETVLIACADHGGGGAKARDHDSAHPADVTIPVLMLGGQLSPCSLPVGTSLLDIAATIPWLLGLRAPAGYAGRPLMDALPGRLSPAA